ncbi:aminotransferase class I/II-fold pyridoxal phosphate-dependent enzyme [Pseudomonas putida]|uniref:Aminotransferase class I/II-fold pyridoxal phosphate-dependent enzyme n=1 Tax=Pseudomonas putida TaxID=303 RepID=A0A6I6Y3S3_PSEPU|nr:aminotransferase class I/II-fold pyridoxal phosphate-dependent enzyme [Pseudomonas putida]QHG66291.1 aminotransferase class I/II-fold pyridoxal phosphate-dependent enzyme [Pseudomonas putida]
MKNAKRTITDLALFGADPLFVAPRSTSSLVAPDFDRFLSYSRVFYDAHQYTNNGPVVQMLEQRLADFHQTRFCITFCSGFWALVLTIRALALPGRKELLMPSLTYRRMADVAAWAGLTPRFCDVDADTLAISAHTARSHINDDTALILGVHPIVNCCDVTALEQLSQDTGIPLFLDAVESVYETFDGRKVGSFGVAECFSLHASKLLNGFEGGYITTNDAALAQRLLAMRGFGFYTPDNVVELGMNAKLNEVHAAMALAGLDNLEQQVADNRQRYRIYQRELQGIVGARLVAFDETEGCGFKNILIELLDAWPLPRELTIRLLNAEHVLARAYYSPPLHMKTSGYPTLTGQLPVTEYLAERYLLLPCGNFVDEQDIVEVCRLMRFLSEQAEAIQEMSIV